jgi:hypothetical protein
MTTSPAAGATRTSRPTRTSRRLRVVLAATIALGLSALAPVAQADDADPVVTPFSSGQCSVGNFCIWSGTGYSGAFWQSASLGLQNTGISTAGSVWNRMGVDVRMYSSTGGGGTIRCWQNGIANSSVAVGSASVRTMTPTTC